MTDQPGNGSRAITIRPDDTSLSVAQAIYHHVTAKTERIVETYKDSYTVTPDDIIQLYHKIKQLAQRHHEEEWSCFVDHAIYKKERIRHTSIDRFKISDLAHSDPTSEVIFSYDFLARNPMVPVGTEIKPERYQVFLTVSQESYLQEQDNLDDQPSFIRRMSAAPSIRLYIEYVDYTIARSILSTVREWIEGLPTVKRPKIISSLLRQQFNIASAVPSIIACAVLIGLGNLSFSAYAGNNIETYFRILCNILATSAIMFSVGVLVVEMFVSSAFSTHPPTSIIFTKGDRSLLEKIEKKRTRAKTMLFFWGGSVILAILINLFSSYLYDKLS